MRLFPDERLLAVAGAWLVAALAAVAAPAWWPAVWLGLGLLAAIALVDAGRLLRRPPLVAERVLPERAIVGRALGVTLRAHNPGEAPVVVSLLDEIPGALGAAEPRVTLTVPPGGAVEHRYVVRPTRRGDAVFGPLVRLERSPAGWWRRRAGGGAGAVLRVFPDTTALVGRHALDARRTLALLGVRPARRRGEGMEFESLRDYVPGDDPRRIDWAATVRRGRLVTRRHQHERNHTVVVAVDTSRLMAARVGERTKLDCAVDAALAIVHAALAAGDRASLVLFDRTVHAHLVPRAHRRRFAAFLEALRTAAPALVEVDYAPLARALATRQRQRALVVVLSDLLETDEAALGPLATLARRHRMLFVAVRDPVFDALVPGRDAPGADLHRRLVLDDLMHGRELALARLRRAGIDAVDLSPHRLTVAVLDRYLPLRLEAA